MSETVQRKLLVHRDSKGLIAMLAHIPSLEFVRFVVTLEPLQIDATFSKALSSDVQPSSRLAVAASPEDTAIWLRSLLRKAGVKRSCYLKVSDYGSAPWAEIRLKSSEEWLIALWGRLTNHAFLVVNHGMLTLLIVDEEEYWYEAYLQDLPEQPSAHRL